VTRDEHRYLVDLAGLDAIHLGMLWPSVSVKRPEEVRERLAQRGLIRILPEPTPYGDLVVELTTKGHRALQRLERIT
jgi:hypothetical protein